MNQPKIALKNK